jgi:hypothetical protein
MPFVTGAFRSKWQYHFLFCGLLILASKKAFDAGCLKGRAREGKTQRRLMRAQIARGCCSKNILP